MTAKTNMVNKDFVHLHNHSHYSLLDGLQKIPQMLDRVAELGMSAVALTDHGTLSGAIEFYKEAKSRGIKPIIGLETYVARRGHLDKDSKEDSNPYHLTLLAKDNEGYRNLMELSSIASLEGFYYRPRIDRQLLKKYRAGLIVLSGCASGEIGMALRDGQMEKAETVAMWYKNLFGDSYYLELQDHSHVWAVQKQINQGLLELSRKLDIPAVITADAHYALPTDQDAHEVLLCVQTGSQLSDDKRMSLKDMHLFVSDPKDISKRWQEYPDLLTNTNEIASRCDVDIEFGKILIPKFETPAGVSEALLLEQHAYRGLAWRYTDKSRSESHKLSKAQISKLVSQDRIQRLEYELGVINKMGFAGYFLIVADFVNWGKKQGIVFGPGRGSTAGSIVAYALNITELDPLKYDLLFERFLNPERISMPDMDIDIQDSRRDEVIQYVVEKYGKDRVAHIATFGTMAARNAIRDTARVLGVPYGDADRLAKMFPPPVQGRHIPMSTTLKENTEIKREYRHSAQSRQVIDLASRLEGTIRSHGVHAAGVVIAPDKITKFTPLEMAQKGVIATQYSMNPIEELGLLKMDFLGLSNLTIIKNALRVISKVYGKNIDIDSLPLDDDKTYKLLGRGETTGVFQLESPGMKRYIKQLRPDRFEDIIAMVSLYRPGPLTAGLTQKFIDRKNGREVVSYEHDSMKAALESTYGVLVYQEQVMRIAQDMAGFSGGQADTLRKAIGKKKRDVMAKMKKEFIEGAIAKSDVSKSFVEKFWKDLEGFADYAFNKSHAACYGLIAYQTAYLKAHYPDAFMAALLTSDFENSDRIAIELEECKKMGIDVLPPDINESFVEFAVVPNRNAIRFGLAAIKNVGVGAVEKILQIREKAKFKSVEDFANRVNTVDVNRKTWESLIKAGAFDSLGDRSQLYYSLDGILSFATRSQRDNSSGQVDMFGQTANKNSDGVVPKLQLQTAQAGVSERERLGWERELLGVFLTKHPLDEYKDYLSSALVQIKDLSAELENRTVTVGGMVAQVKKITTRKGANMAFVVLEDLTDKVELIVFPKIYQQMSDYWQQDQVLKVSGKLTTKDRDGNAAETKILVDSAEVIDPEMTSEAAIEPKPDLDDNRVRIIIQIPDTNDLGKLTAMKELLLKYRGDTEVFVMVGDDSATRIRLPFTVEASDELRQDLEVLFSKEAIAIKRQTS